MLKTQFNGQEYEIRKWQGESLGLKIAIDTETTMAPFTETPELITFQATDGTCVYYVERDEVDSFFMKNSESIFVMHHAPFDIDVICKHVGDRNYFHKFIEKDQVRDTNLLFRLVHLATVGHVPFKSSLAHISERLLNVEISKDEAIRTTFDVYQGKSIVDISPDHLAYGAIDVIATLACYNRLHNMCQSTGSTTLLSHQIQLVGAVALNRIYKNGINFDTVRGRAKLEELESAMEYSQAQLANYGWVRGVKGTKQRFEDIITNFNITLPRTESGDLSSKSEDLLPYKNNPFVKHYLKFHELEKLSSFIRDLVE